MLQIGGGKAFSKWKVLFQPMHKMQRTHDIGLEKQAGVTVPEGP